MFSLTHGEIRWLLMVGPFSWALWFCCLESFTNPVGWLRMAWFCLKWKGAFNPCMTPQMVLLRGWCEFFSRGKKNNEQKMASVVLSYVTIVQVPLNYSMSGTMFLLLTSLLTVCLLYMVDPEGKFVIACICGFPPPPIQLLTIWLYVFLHVLRAVPLYGSRFFLKMRKQCR